MPSTPLSLVRRWAPSLAAFIVAILAPMLFAQPPGYRRPITPAPAPPMQKLPTFTPPIIQPQPHIEHVWICEKCGHEISHGEAPPIGVHCPGCGVLITGITFAGMHTPPMGNLPASGSVPPVNVPLIPPVSQPSVNPRRTIESSVRARFERQHY